MTIKLSNAHTGEVMHVHHTPADVLTGQHDLAVWLAMKLGPYGVSVETLPETLTEGRYGIASGKRIVVQGHDGRPMSPFGGFLFNTFKQDH